MQWSVSFSIYRRSKQCERAIKQTLIVAKEFNVIALVVTGIYSGDA